MQKLENVIGVSANEAIKALEAAEQKGVIVGGSFEPRLPVGNHSGVCTGKVDIIYFIYKTGKDAGKQGGLIVAQVTVESETVGVNITKKDVPAMQPTAVIDFEVKLDKNSVKRANIIKIADTNLNGNVEAQVEALEAEIEAKKAEIKTLSGTAKTAAKKELASLEAKLEELEALA